MDKKNIFETLYKEAGFTRGSLVVNNGVSSFVANDEGDIYIDSDNNIYPSDNIFDEDNKYFYETLFDFDFKELEGLSIEEIEIKPATLNGEKGKITKKELTEEETFDGLEVGGEEVPSFDIGVGGDVSEMTEEEKAQMIREIQENVEKNADPVPGETTVETTVETPSKETAKGLNEKYLKAGLTPGYLGRFLDRYTFEPYALNDSFFFQDENHKLLPTDKIFNPKHTEFYKYFYDFDFEEITKAEDFDIEPASLLGEKGKITPKGLSKDSSNEGTTEIVEENQEELTSTEKNPEEIVAENSEEILENEVTPEETTTKEGEILEGPAITQYKLDTEALREKIAQMKSEIEASENKELDELIELTSLEQDEILDREIKRWQEQQALFERRLAKFIAENPNYNDDPKTHDDPRISENPEVLENYRRLQEEYKLHLESIETVKQKVESLKQEKEKNLEQRKTVFVEVWKFREYYEKEIKKLETTLQETKAIRDKFYDANMGIPLELYGIMNQIEQQIDPQIKPLIEKMKKDLDEKCGIRSEIDINAPENLVLIENIKAARKVNTESNLTINAKFADKKTTNETSNPDLTSLEQELAEREENIKKYYEALDLIKDIENDVSNGKLEEIKVENAKEKIASITDEGLREELNKYLDKALKNEKDVTKSTPTPSPEPTPEEKKEEPIGKDNDPEIPKKGKLKVKAKKALKWMKEHKLVTIGLGLALVTALMFAMPTTHMMINSALWHAGKGLGWSSASLANLHNINLGLSKAVGGGKFIFDSVSGAYTLGGVTGASALYTAAGAKLVGTITALTGLGAVGTLGKAVVDKIKNRKKKEKKPEVKEGPETSEKEEVEEKTEGKEKSKEQEVEKTSGAPVKTGDTPSSEAPTDTEKTTDEPVATTTDTSKEELEQIKEMLTKLMEQNKAIETRNEELLAEIERLKAMGITPEGIETEHKMSM